jgi:hypothetical protein
MTLSGKTFQPDQMYVGRLEPTRVKHFSGAPLYGRLLASPTNIRLGLKGLPRTNTLAYYENHKLWPQKVYGTGSCPHPRTLDLAGKACQGQTLYLITKICKLRPLKVYGTGSWPHPQTLD